MILDDEFLDKVRDSRYSSAWVGIAVRWQLAKQEKDAEASVKAIYDAQSSDDIKHDG